MSLAHLPVAMVATLTALRTDLAAWADAHPESSLADAETAVLAAVRRQLPTLLAAVLTETIGLTVSAERIRGVTEAAGTALRVAEDAAAAQVAATGAPADPVVAALINGQGRVL